MQRKKLVEAIKQHRQRILGIILIILFFGFFLWGVFAPDDRFYNPDNIRYKFTSGATYSVMYSYIYFANNNTSHRYNTTISYTTTYDLSAKGSFSANNPIQVGITIANMSATRSYPTNGTYPISLKQAFNFYGFDLHYKYAFLTGSQYRINSSDAFLPLAQVKNGTYTASAEVNFIKTGTTYLILAGPTPNSPAFRYQFNVRPDTFNPVIDIQPVSDTISIKFNQYIARLTWILGTFSILLMQPVIEAIITKTEKSHKHKTANHEDTTENRYT